MTQEAIDMRRIRRESIRWHIMQILDVARPIGANESMIMSVLVELYDDVTPVELRRELDYLDGLQILTIEKCERIKQWRGKLTTKGIDIAEYVEDCPKSIDRPRKYW